MIRDVKFWTEWERQGPLSEPLDFERNLKLMDAMYEYARLLGRWDRTDPLEGVEIKIKMARVLNVSTSAGKDRSGT